MRMHGTVPSLTCCYSLHIGDKDGMGGKLPPPKHYNFPPNRCKTQDDPPYQCMSSPVSSTDHKLTGFHPVRVGVGEASTP